MLTLLDAAVSLHLSPLCLEVLLVLELFTTRQTFYLHRRVYAMLYGVNAGVGPLTVMFLLSNTVAAARSLVKAEQWNLRVLKLNLLQ
jgi:hypothetical protein